MSERWETLGERFERLDRLYRKTIHSDGLEAVYQDGYAQAVRDVLAVVEGHPLTTFVQESIRAFAEERGIVIEERRA